MPKRLILIAHAETSATRRGVFPTGEHVEPRGRDRASSLAAAMPKDATALASPAPAARETAQALGLVAEVDPALADLDVGAWAGRSVMDIGSADPQAATAWIEDPAFAGHGGESFEMLIRRVGTWLAARLDIKGVTVAVTHAAVLRAAAIYVTSASPSAIWRIEAGPLAMLSLSSDGRRWAVRELRQHAHEEGG